MPSLLLGVPLVSTRILYLCLERKENESEEGVEGRAGVMGLDLTRIDRFVFRFTSIIPRHGMWSREYKDEVRSGM